MKKMVLAILILLASEVVVRMLNGSTSPPPALPLTKPLHELPRQIGDWKGADIALNPRVFASSGANDSVKRSYRNSLGHEISLFAGTWLDYPPSIPHRPELCYSTNGWDLAERVDVEIPQDGDIPFSARVLSCRNNGQAIHVLYWIDLAGSRSADDERVRQALQDSRRQGTPRPALLKVMLQSSQSDVNRAKQDLIEFAAQVAVQLETVQTEGPVAPE